MSLLVLLACLKRAPVSPLDGAVGEVGDCATWEDVYLARALNRQTNTVEHQGNSAELLVDGVQSFDRRIRLAAEADVLLVKTFIYADDEIGQLTTALLKQRAEAGAVVVLQVDIKGSISGLEDVVAAFDGGLPQLAGLEEAGVVVVYTNVPGQSKELEAWVSDRAEATEWSDRPKQRSLWNFDHFDHEKYWIAGTMNADGELVYEAILGGMNIASEYAYGGTNQTDDVSGRGGWRDLDVALRGPVVNDVVARYLDLLALNGPEALPFDAEVLNPPQPEAGTVKARFVWNQPAVLNERRIEQAVKTHVAHTPEGEIIRLSMAYFAPGPGLMRSFRASLRRGRRLAVITNSPISIDVPLVADASRSAYAQLLRVHPNAALYEWQPSPGHQTLHAKAASFGTCGPVMIGSANLDGQSSEHNSESVVFLQDPQLRAAFDAMFDADIDESLRITVGDIERASLWKRLKGRGIYRAGWYFLSL